MTSIQWYIALKMLIALTLCMSYLIYEYRKAGKPPKSNLRLNLNNYRRMLISRMRSRRKAPYICPHHALDLALGQMAVLEPGKCDVCKIDPDKNS